MFSIFNFAAAKIRKFPYATMRRGEKKDNVGAKQLYFKLVVRESFEAIQQYPFALRRHKAETSGLQP